MYRSDKKKYANFVLMIITSLVVGSIALASGIAKNYTWSRDYGSSWSLAEKASSIPAKQELLDKFYKSLVNGKEKGHFADNNAKYLSTPDNSFDANLRALKTLVDRLEEIKQMDPTSFQYNTAIQQITAQEQGEAKSMLNVFEGCYALQNYPLAWDWIAGICLGLAIVFAFIGVCGICVVLNY